MPKVITLPNLGADIKSGIIEAWCKEVGDRIEKGDIIAEISTDKAIIEVEVEETGTLGKILVPAGPDDVPIDTPIALLLLEGESESDASDLSTSTVAPVTEETAAAPAKQVAESKQVKKQSRIISSPSGRRIAAELGVDLSLISGSGPRGRIVKGDIEIAAENMDSPVKSVLTNDPLATDAGGYMVVANDKVRKVIAKRLGEAKREIPHFYLTIDFEIDALLELRRQLNEMANGEFKLSINDLIIKACARALRDVPAANSSWSDDAVLQYNDVDICVAVAGRNGLMTPIIRQADQKGLATISREVRELAEKVRGGKLRPHEYQGGGFTISNLGMYGVREFSAIINPPQSCILAVGAGEKRAVVHDGKLAIATVMTCTLSVDHRSVDGAVGAEFLQSLIRHIEQPVSLLADGL